MCRHIDPILCCAVPSRFFSVNKNLSLAVDLRIESPHVPICPSDLHLGHLPIKGLSKTCLTS